MRVFSNTKWGGDRATAKRVSVSEPDCGRHRLCCTDTPSEREFKTIFESLWSFYCWMSRDSFDYQTLDFLKAFSGIKRQHISFQWSQRIANTHQRVNHGKKQGKILLYIVPAKLNSSCMKSFPEFYGMSALLDSTRCRGKETQEGNTHTHTHTHRHRHTPKNTLQDFKAFKENFTTGRLGGLAELNSACL